MGKPTWLARTRRLDREVDLVRFAGDDGVVFEHEGIGLAARGTAWRVSVPALDAPAAAQAVNAAFAQIAVEDEVGLPGCGPVGFGAFPFDPAERRALHIPRVIVGRAPDGTRWLTTIDAVTPGGSFPPPADPSTLDLGDSPRSEGGIDPGEIHLRSARSATEWRQALLNGRQHLRSGGPLRKFVLAREVIIETERALPRGLILERLRTGYPTCYITAVDAMVGASPELLVSRRGDIVRSRPLAGTAPRNPDPVIDARLAANLLASAKNREEHQVVIDMIRDTLLPWCSYLDAEPEPSVMGMANVQHLATFLEGRLSSPPASAIELVTVLHPTPAICGTPTDLALEVIRELEGTSRAAYAGPVGWVDHTGNGDWVVGIRSAELVGPRARVFAGVGVMADSDPDEELAETRAKFQAILSALVRP